MKNPAIAFVLAAGVLLAAGTPALAEQYPVFACSHDNGWFTPFDSSTSESVRYGDSGWLSDYTTDTFTLTQIDLHMVTLGGTTNGVTDLVFTFNDGSPSGLVFGSGDAFYSTVLEDVVLPISDADSSYYEFTIEVPLPNVETLGGYNNVGWSIGVQNFDFDGEFGFQCSSTTAQAIGYYTNNACQYDGSDWSLFAFGSDPTYGVANFSTIIYAPEPGTAMLLALGLLGVLRRR